VEADFAKLLEVRTDVLKALEEARAAKEIGTAQEAELDLTLPQEEADLLTKGLKGAAAQWMIVSKAVVTAGAERSVKVVKASGTKCPRCWNYSETPDENGLCPRCHSVMSK